MVEKDLEKGSEGWEICLGSSHPGPPLLKDLLGKHEDNDELYNFEKKKNSPQSDMAVKDH